MSNALFCDLIPPTSKVHCPVSRHTYTFEEIFQYLFNLGKLWMSTRNQQENVSSMETMAMTTR